MCVLRWLAWCWYGKISVCVEVAGLVLVWEGRCVVKVAGLVLVWEGRRVFEMAGRAGLVLMWWRCWC